MGEYVEERDGTYYVTGTRVSLDSLVYAFGRGESPETIRQNFDTLQLDEVYGAIAWYLRHQSEVDSYLIRQREKCEQGRRNADPLPEDLRARLGAARSHLHGPRPR
jgi:uncharacterized protein (DUF433 family)